MAGIREEMERNMSGLSSRWKEMRIREEIYKQTLRIWSLRLIARVGTGRTEQ